MKNILLAAVLVTSALTSSFGQVIMYNSPICAGTVVRFMYSGSCTVYWSLDASATKVGPSTTYSTYVDVKWNSPTTTALVQAICQSNQSLSASTGNLTVSGVVAPTVSLFLSPNTVCPTGNISLTATGTNGGSSPTYTWLVDGNTVTTTSSSSYSYSAQNLSSGSHQSAVKLNNSNACSSTTYPSVTSASVPFTVQSQISYSVMLNNQVAVCQGTAPSFLAYVSGSSGLDFTKLTYNWYVNSVGPKTDNTSGRPDVYQPSGVIHNGDAIYCIVTSSQSGCIVGPQQSNTQNAIITTLVTPTISASVIPAGTTFCSGQSITFSANVSGASGGVYSWTYGSTTGTGSTFTLQAADNMNDASHYKPGDNVSVTVQNLLGCLTTTTLSTSASTASIGLRPTISGTNSFCSNAPSVLTANVAGGLTPTSYQWLKDGSTLSGANSSTYQIIAQNASVSNNYSVIANYSGCSSSSASPFGVTEKILPQGTMSLSVPEICFGSSVTVSGSGTGTTSYSCSSNGGQTWDVFDGAFSGQNSFSFQPSSPGQYQLKLVLANDCGQSAPLYQNLIVDLLADPVAISGPPTIYAGKEYSFSVASTLNNDSYQWTVVGGIITQGQATSAVKVEFYEGGGSLSVIASNAKCGNGVSRSINVSVQKMNYIREETILVTNVTNETQISALPVENRSSSTVYFDGLGRQNQHLSWQSSPSKKDIIVPAVYDSYGREVKKYLPFVMTDGVGYYRPDLMDANGNCTANTYSNSAGNIASDLQPYSQAILETSPLSRPLQQFGPGQDWTNNNKSISHQYLVNQTNEVIMFSYDPLTGMVSGKVGGLVQYYDAGQLYSKLTTDEHGNDVIEYIDKLGHLVCKKVQYKIDATTGNKLYTSTYYLYNDLGDLVVVLPPEAVRSIVPNQN
jgi:hypothetical protein